MLNNAFFANVTKNPIPIYPVETADALHDWEKQHAECLKTAIKLAIKFSLLSEEEGQIYSCKTTEEGHVSLSRLLFVSEKMFFEEAIKNCRKEVVEKEVTERINKVKKWFR